MLVALSFRPDDFISSDSLSGTCKTNPVVVRRVVSSLKRAGLVDSQPGATGGVRLAKPTRRISLLEVYRALGSVELFRMHKPNPACPIGKRIPDALTEFLPGPSAPSSKAWGRRAWKTWRAKYGPRSSRRSSEFF